MSQLSEYLELIKKEKDTKLLPKNINNGVTIFGVPGNSDFTVKVDATKQSSSNVLSDYIVEIKNLDLSYISKTYLSSFFSSLTNLKKISFTSRNNITNMYNLFSGCYQLEEVDFSNVDTSNVTDMENMFYNCSSLTSIPQLNTSKVASMLSMFYGCSSLTSIPLFDTSNVTSMWNMFQNCRSLTSIPQLDTSNVTNMRSMFQGCTNLTTVPQLDTSKVISMQAMFTSCTNLSNESLNNILAMCANTTSAYTQTKTLNYIGLTSAQATTCQGLSNYQDFIDAGWTTGY